MPFTNYEQIHLHRYVDRKAVTDIKINLLKNEIDKTLASLKTEIINLIPSSDPVNPNLVIKPIIQEAISKYHTNLINE